MIKLVIKIILISTETYAFNFFWGRTYAFQLQNVLTQKEDLVNESTWDDHGDSKKWACCVCERAKTSMTHLALHLVYPVMWALKSHDLVYYPTTHAVCEGDIYTLSTKVAHTTK